MVNYTIKGQDIKRLVTRFQYKKQDMCFEILLKLNNSPEMILFLKTTEYSHFKNKFDELMNIRTENGTLHLTMSKQDNVSLRTNAA